MSELKTLEDIAKDFGGMNINHTAPIIKNFGLDFDEENAGDVAHLLNHLWTDLRQEAVKWIQDWKERSKFKFVIMESGEVAWHDSCLKNRNKFMEKLILTKNMGKIEMLVIFFNIKEEDLT